MPTYEYACASCGRRFEVVQRFSDAPLEVCEVCGGALKRVFHPVGIVLKGSGFYSTDNRSGKSLGTSGTKESSAGESKSETKSETKSESKPAEKKADPKPDSGKSA